MQDDLWSGGPTGTEVHWDPSGDGDHAACMERGETSRDCLFGASLSSSLESSIVSGSCACTADGRLEFAESRGGDGDGKDDLMTGRSDPPLTPEVRRIIEHAHAAAANWRRPTVTDIVELRQRTADQFVDRVLPQELAVVDIEDVSADGPEGVVPIRLYRPPLPGPLPVHVYFHGGAFLLGSAFSPYEVRPMCERAIQARCAVAAVEYRLAPEHRFPAGLEDCYAAILWLAEHASELGLDAGLMSVGGVSSGGNFAAVVPLMIKDRGGPALRLQLLEVAGTDLTKSSRAWREPETVHDTTRERDLALIDLYVAAAPDKAHPYASPLFAPDLSGLPPAYVMNAEYDPRRDECEAYAARLGDAGVPVTVRTMSGHVHASPSLLDWEPAVQWRAEANAAIRSANEVGVGLPSPESQAHHADDPPLSG